MLDVADFAPNPAAPELLSLRAAARADDPAMDDIAMAGHREPRQFMNGGEIFTFGHGLDEAGRSRTSPAGQARRAHGNGSFDRLDPTYVILDS